MLQKTLGIIRISVGEHKGPFTNTCEGADAKRGPLNFVDP